MTPELATDQARGIIIRDALTTLICTVQFGITVLHMNVGTLSQNIDRRQDCRSEAQRYESPRRWAFLRARVQSWTALLGCLLQLTRGASHVTVVSFSKQPDQPLVFAMRAHPEPVKDLIFEQCKRSVARTDADRPNATGLLEL